MKMAEVKEIAKEKGVKPGKMKKIDLIRTIQTTEGNSPCFQSEIAATCSIENCLWREDCIK